ncbi:MAG: M67 family metallopeptidase [Gemmataceae bacterium]
MNSRYILHIPHQVYVAMLDQARAELPNECCGILAGKLGAGVGTVSLWVPLVNDHANPTRRFHTQDRSMLAAERTLREADLDWLALYHSHPASAAVPSATDLAENPYGDARMNLIISLQAGQPDLRAWWLLPATFEEGKWEFAGDSES